MLAVAGPHRGPVPLDTENLKHFASSAELVGRFWLRNRPKAVIQSQFDRFAGAKPVRFLIVSFTP